MKTSKLFRASLILLSTLTGCGSPCSPDQLSHSLGLSVSSAAEVFPTIKLTMQMSGQSHTSYENIFVMSEADALILVDSIPWSVADTDQYQTPSITRQDMIAAIQGTSEFDYTIRWTTLDGTPSLELQEAHQDLDWALIELSIGNKVTADDDMIRFESHRIVPARD